MKIKSSEGSVLIVTLLLMTMLTVIAISQISFNHTQTHIATNSADVQVAFHTAEGALNEATNNLLAGTYLPSAFLSNANGLYLPDLSTTPLWSTINWNSTSAVIKSFQGKSNAQAAYMVEQLPSVVRPGQNMNSPTSVYRITARGVGASGNTIVTLQSTMQLQ